MIQSIIIITIIIMNVYAKKRKEKIYLPTTYLHIIMTLYHDTYQLIKCSWQNFHKFTSLFVGVSAIYVVHASSPGWWMVLVVVCPVPAYRFQLKIIVVQSSCFRLCG